MVCLPAIFHVFVLLRTNQRAITLFCNDVGSKKCTSMLIGQKFFALRSGIRLIYNSTPVRAVIIRINYIIILLVCPKQGAHAQ